MKHTGVSRVFLASAVSALVLASGGVAGPASAAPGGALIATIPLAAPYGAPLGIAMAPDGRSAYVTQFGDYSVVRLDVPSLSKGTTTTLAGTPRGVSVHPTTGEVWIADSSTSELAVMSSALAPITTIIGPADPFSIAFSLDGAFAFAAYESGAVARFDAITKAEITRVGTDFAVKSIKVSPTGALWVVEGLSLKRLNSTSLSTLGTITGFTRPEGFTFSADGLRAYVTDYSADVVRIVNTDPESSNFETSIGSFPVGDGPTDITLIGSTAWTVNRLDNTVTAYDLSTATTLATVNAGIDPVNIVATPDGRQVWITNSLGNTVTVLNSEWPAAAGGWLVKTQGLPVPSSGSCADVVDTGYGWGTGLSGGWQRSWQPWVGAPGIGGWACMRTLVNKGNSWVIDNSLS